MALALFDLDNTLLAGDSDYEWGQYLVSIGVVDKAIYEAANLKFYEQYKNGTLDIYEFLAFAFTPLTQYSRSELNAWRSHFVEERIRPLMLEKGKEKIQWHKALGDTPVVITATNSFVTAPIVAAFGIEHLIATTPEEIDGEFTGQVDGVPCFQEGKVLRLQQWLEGRDMSLDGSWFYSDSHNDMPLLERVTTSVAVDPDKKLDHVARQRGWRIESFR